MTGRRVAIAATLGVLVLGGLWMAVPVARGFHIGQSTADTQCMSRVFLWCRVAPVSSAVLSDPDRAAGSQIPGRLVTVPAGTPGAVFNAHCICWKSER